MLYDLYEPLPELQPYVGAFWVQEKSSISFSRAVMLPDSYIELIIALGPPQQWELETGLRIDAPSASLVRLQREPMRVHPLQDFRAIGIHLHAWSARPLVGKQTNLEEPYIKLDETWQHFARDIEHTVQQQGYPAAVAHLQQVVAEMYRRSSFDVTPVRHAGTLLQATHGQLGIYDLADQCYISPSQLQRNFKDYVGVSPKTYARIVRFETICDRLLNDPTYPTLELASEFGYADQAHFIRDFKTLSTQTPREFAANVSQQKTHQQDAAFFQLI